MGVGVGPGDRWGGGPGDRSGERGARGQVGEGGGGAWGQVGEGRTRGGAWGQVGRGGVWRQVGAGYCQRRSCQQCAPRVLAFVLPWSGRAWWVWSLSASGGGCCCSLVWAVVQGPCLVLPPSGSPHAGLALSLCRSAPAAGVSAHALEAGWRHLDTACPEVPGAAGKPVWLRQ